MSFREVIQKLYAEAGRPDVQVIAGRLGMRPRVVENVLIEGMRRDWVIVEAIVDALGGGSPIDRVASVELARQAWNADRPEQIPRIEPRGMPEVIVCMNDDVDAGDIADALTILGPLGVLKPAPHGWLIVPFGAGRYVITDER